MTDQTKALAAAFAAILKEWASPEEWVTMRRANAGYSDPTICASHDFCDANMAMDEAFDKLGIAAPGDEGCEDGTSEHEAACALWNAAWAMAKKEHLTGCGWEVEFPDFEPSDIPAIPEGFEDVSWRNDSCPSFMNEAAGLIIFVEREDAAEREIEETARFNLAVWDQGADAHIAGGEDFDVVLEAIANHPAKDLPAVQPNTYGVHYMRGGYMVVWADRNGLTDLVDMGEGSTVPLSPDEPYPVFATREEARRYAAAASFGPLAVLALEYAVWCSENNLPHVSADEQDPERITTVERDWLADFIARWEAVQNAIDHGAQG